MTRPFVPIVFDALTSSVSLDPSNERRGLMSFAVGGSLYAFVIDRTALQRLSRQLERVLQQIPPPSRKRKLPRS